MSALDSSRASTSLPCVDLDSQWATIERGLSEWDDLCKDLDAGDSIYASDSEQTRVAEGLAGAESMLRRVARLLAKSHQAQATQGKATMLLLRQAMTSFQGCDMASVTQMAQGLRSVSDWVQQVEHLNTELRVQRYSWQQLHSQLEDTQAALQRSQLEILEKDQLLLLVQCELDLARQEQGSRLAGQQALASALQNEVQQLRLQLEVQQQRHASTAGAPAAEQAAAGGLSKPTSADSDAQLQLAAERATNDELRCQVQQLQLQFDRGMQEHRAALADVEHRLSAAVAEAESAAVASVAAAQARAHQAEAALVSERELSESLTEELGLVQARLAALQQEHGALKRESALLVERTMMSEDGLEDARQAAEEAVQAASLQAAALRQELAAAQDKIRELQAELDSSARRRPSGPLSTGGPAVGNGQGGSHHSKKNSLSGGPAVGGLSVEASPAKGVSEQVHGRHRSSFEGNAASHSHRTSFEGGATAGGGAGGLPPMGPHVSASTLVAVAEAAAGADANVGMVAGTPGTGDMGAGGASPAALPPAEARAMALEQELLAVRQQLAVLLQAGQQQCQASGLADPGENEAGVASSRESGGGAGGAGVAAGGGGSAASALLGVLRCTELLFTRQMHGTSLSKVRMLQAELEGVLQGALSPGSCPEHPVVLREIQALRSLQQQCEASGALHFPGQGAGSVHGGQAHGEAHGLGCAKGMGGGRATDDGCAAEGWEDVDEGESWFSHEHVSPVGFQGSSSGAGVGRSPHGSSGGRDGGVALAHVDDGLQDLEAMWELPPLPPPPQFD